MFYTLPPFKIEKSNVETFYPLLPMQRSMAAKTIESPGKGMYLIQVSYRISGKLDVSCFQQAWKDVIQQHSILRSGFSRLDTEKPLQVICRDIPLPWLDFNLSNTMAPEQEFNKWLQVDRSVDLDLTRPGLMRLALLKLGEEEYRFVWTHHHAISDGWSIPVVINQVLAAYQSVSQNKRTWFPPCAQYQQLVTWLQTQETQQSKAFWQQHIGDISSPSLLKPTQSSTAPPSDLMLEHTFTLNDELFSLTEALCQKAAVTQNVLFSGVFGLTLSRYLGMHESIFGYVTAGRNADIANIENMVGPCMNTLVQKVSCNDNLTVLEWLAELMQSHGLRTRHEHLPLSDIIELTNKPTMAEVFNCLFVYENYPRMLSTSEQSTDSKPDLLLEPIATSEANSFPFSFIVAPGTRCTIRIAAQARSFFNAFLQQFADDFVNLLQQVVNEPLKVLGSLQLVSAKSINSLFQSNNKQVSLVDNFDEQISHYSDNVAIEFDHGQLTYKELEKRSNQLAYKLLQQGVNVGDRVAIALSPGVEQVLSMLAVLRVGACYVPLDISNPASRNEYIINDAAVVCVISENNCSFELGDRNRISPSKVPAESHQESINRSHPDNPAYVIYTSGTTGKPKGVLINQAQVVRLFESTKDGFNFTEKDVWLLLHSFAFDFSVWEIWGALLHGGKLCIPPAGIGKDSEALLSYIAQRQISVLNITPSAFYPLALLACEKQVELKALHSIIFGGEKLEPALLKNWCQHYPLASIRLVNMYGITEITVHATYHRLTKQDVESGASVIGTPLADMCIELRNAEGHITPPGMTGEMWLSGAGVSSGYINQPEIAQDKFVPSVSGKIWYRSGDAAYLDEANRLVYVNRLDNQIQLRGFRIEPGEIEAQINTIDGVKMSMVTLITALNGQDVLLALVQDSNIRGTQTYRQMLADKLPYYMIPNQFYRVTAFERTINGKVDVAKTLRALSADSEQQNSQAPLTQTESQIAAIWTDLLKQEITSPHCNFYELGGHSLLATMFSLKYSKAHKVEIPVALVLLNPKLSDLAKEVEKKQTLKGEISIPKVVRGKSYPLSTPQGRLWFLSQIEGAQANYNLPLAVEVRGDLSLSALNTSVQHLLTQHEGLRVGFKLDAGEPKQFIRPIEAYSLEHLDASNWDKDKRQQYIVDFCQYAYDLAADPLCRLMLIKYSDQHHVFIMLMHHILTDAWSNGLLYRDLLQAYSLAAQEGQLTTDPNRIHYLDYAVWQRQHNQQMEQQLAFWQNKLKGIAPELPLPLDFPRSDLARSDAPAAAKNLLAHLSPEQEEQLSQLAQTQGCTLFTLLVSVFQGILAYFTGTNDTVLGTAVANRTHPDVEDVVGFFANTLVLRQFVDNQLSAGQCIAATQSTLEQAFSNQDVAFDEVVEHSGVERLPNVSPLFQVMFVLQPRPLEMVESGPEHLSIEPVKWESKQAKFDITISIQYNNGLDIHLEYNANLFTSDRMQSWLDAFARALSILHEDLKAPLLSLFKEQSAKDQASTENGFDAESLQNMSEKQIQELLSSLPEDKLMEIMEQLEGNI